MTNTLAPIVLFVYKRPKHTLQVLEALSRNVLANESTLYVFADNSKDDATREDLSKIEEVSKIILSKNWCGQTELIKREKNFGLAENIILGVDEVMERHGKAIILEDDIVPSKYFLKYMNDALNLYQNEEKVISIGACNFFAIGNIVPEIFFIPIPDCWGWATWQDRWNLFERDGELLLKLLKEKGLIERFNLFGKYNFEQMLVDQIEGRNNSWAIRWQALAYINNMLTLYPKYTVVKNIGNDIDATHGSEKSIYDLGQSIDRPINVQKSIIQENPEVNKLMLNTYDKMLSRKKMHWINSLKSKLGF